MAGLVPGLLYKNLPDELRDVIRHQGYIICAVIVIIVNIIIIYSLSKDNQFSRKRKIITVKRILNLQPDVQTLDFQKRCLICLTNIKYIACFPCGHLSFCGECAQGYRNSDCLICRGKIQILFGIYN